VKKLFVITLVFVSVLTVTPLFGGPSAHAQVFARAQSRGYQLPQTTTTSNLFYHYGAVLRYPKVFVTFWGWGKLGDPNQEAPQLVNFLQRVGGSSWLNTVTQYGSPVGYITNPLNQFGGSWFDNKNPIPLHPFVTDTGAEANRSALHFGIPPGAAVYIIATPFDNTSSSLRLSKTCAYHYSAATSLPGVSNPFIDLPYYGSSDITAYCGSNPSDEVTIEAGHEYAEAITDPFFYGWSGSGGVVDDEIADKCSNNVPTQSIPFNNNPKLSPQSFTVQALWSNANSTPKGPIPCVFSYSKG